LKQRENQAAENSEELDLAEKIARGDDASFEILVRQYGGQMLAVAKRITRNDADAQDCLQEAFINAYKNMGSFEGRAALGTWLHRIITNVSLMRLRSQRRIAEFTVDAPIDVLIPSFESDGSRSGNTPISDIDEIELLYQRGETREAINRAIDRLPVDYRAVVIARDLEDLSTEETSKLLDISTSLVKTRLHRARAALKTLLEPVVRAGAI